MFLMKKIFQAPAKINLCLHVLGRRPDGYHELCMLMQRVGLMDRVTIELTAGRDIVVECPGLELAEGEQNIARRAACVVLEGVGSSQGVHIRIDKQIPAAAGLGGGSSDAATVLTGLNEMLGAPLPKEQLLREGARLGADVPFFVNGETAWARGVGDILEKASALPRVWYVLVNPGFSVSTAWVYANLGLTTTRDVSKLPEFFTSPGDLAKLLYNDLESVTIGRYPEIALIKRQLLEAGALGALMSGSGPTVFGMFAEQDVAEDAFRQLGKRPDWRVFKVDPLG
jgi:4-diphosphocytidyl-2-C-methyl-D-erythritol kinase